MLSELSIPNHFVDDVGGIQTVHFSDGAITWEKIADSAIDGSKIAMTLSLVVILLQRQSLIVNSILLV